MLPTPDGLKSPRLTCLRVKNNASECMCSVNSFSTLISNPSLESMLLRPFRMSDIQVAISCGSRPSSLIETWTSCISKRCSSVVGGYRVMKKSKASIKRFSCTSTARAASIATWQSSEVMFGRSCMPLFRTAGATPGPRHAAQGLLKRPGAMPIRRFPRGLRRNTRHLSLRRNRQS